MVRFCFRRSGKEEGRDLGVYHVSDHPFPVCEECHSCHPKFVSEIWNHVCL